MKKLLLIVVFFGCGYYMFYKPQKEKEYVAARLGEIEDELLSISNIDNKIAYLIRMLNSETNALVLAELEKKLQQNQTIKALQTTIGTSNMITVKGLTFSYTNAQNTKVATALARIKTDFNEWWNNHFDTIDVYESVANSWREDEVIKLVHDWDSKRGRSFYEAAVKQNWTYGSMWWSKSKKQRMTLAADQFKLRIKNVTNKYF